jgi:GMP synthase (glutamine-hydrolysing)
MVEEGFVRDAEDGAKYIGDLVALDAEPGRRDLAWRLGIAPSVLDPTIRRTELINWLKRQVLPAMSARSRT